MWRHGLCNPERPITGVLWPDRLEERATNVIQPSFGGRCPSFGGRCSDALCGGARMGPGCPRAGNRCGYSSCGTDKCSGGPAPGDDHDLWGHGVVVPVDGRDSAGGPMVGECVSGELRPGAGVQRHFDLAADVRGRGARPGGDFRVGAADQPRGSRQAAAVHHRPGEWRVRAGRAVRARRVDGQRVRVVLSGREDQPAVGV